MPDYDFITTYTGVHFFPTRPDPDGVRIVDVAHALSLLCRGNGHVKTFFSVGQHCLHCAREALARNCSRRVALACLLHDASEAYLSDVPRPFKQHLPQYRALEDRLLTAVYQKYLGGPLTEEEQRQVKQIDDDMLAYDLAYLLNMPPEDGVLPKMASEFSYEVLPFATVEEQYVTLFQNLYTL